MPQSITGNNIWTTSTTVPIAGDTKAPSDISTPVQALMNRTEFNYQSVNTMASTVSTLSSTVSNLSSTVGTLTANKLVFNVKDYGALGNGSANDAAAIQAAFDAAYAAAGNTTNSIVFFPTGVYRIATAVQIKTSVTGANAVIRSSSTTNTNCMTVAGYNNITISNLTFDGNLAGAGPDDNYTGTYGLVVGPVGSNITVMNCVFVNTKVHACLAQRVSEFKFLNNSISAHRFVTNSYAVGLFGVKDAIVIGNTIRDFAGIAIGGTAIANTWNRRLIIANNNIFDNVAPSSNAVCRGVSLGSCVNAIIMGNQISGIRKGAATACIGIFTDFGGAVSTPATPTGSTATTGGTIAAGTYYAKVTHITEEGESIASAATTAITTTGSTSTITVTGPNIGAGINNVKAIGVYLTPTSASPGTEIYAGQYTTGTSLVITALPSGTAAAPTVSTASKGAGILVTDNRVNMPESTSSIFGFYFNNSSHGQAVYPIFVKNNSFVGGMTGAYLANPPGPTLAITDNHFDSIALQNSTGSGVIAIDRASSTTTCSVLIRGCTKSNIDYSGSGNLVGDIHILAAGTGAGAINPLELTDLNDTTWYLNLRTAVTQIESFNCKLATDNATYARSLFFVTANGLVTHKGTDFIAPRSGTSNSLTNTGASTVNLANCSFTNFTLSGNTSGSHQFRASDTIFTNSQILWDQGTLNLVDCDVLSVPTNGFVYGATSNVTSNVNAMGGTWTSAGQPFINKSGFNMNVRASGINHTGATLINGLPGTSILVENLLPTKLTVTTNSASVDQYAQEVYVNPSPAGPTSLTLVAANTTNKGRKITIIDEKGDAQTNNITISPSSGTINGAASYVINLNAGTVTLVSNPTTNNWQVVSTSIIPTSSAGAADEVPFSFGDKPASNAKIMYSITRAFTLTSPSTNSTVGWLTAPADRAEFKLFKSVATSTSEIGRVALTANASSTSFIAGSTTGFNNATGAAAQFVAPTGVAVHPVTQEIFVFDSTGHRIRKIDRDAVVTTAAGTGSAGNSDNAVATTATVNGPRQGVFNSTGTKLYWTDAGGHTVRMADVTVTSNAATLSNVVTMAGLGGTSGNAVGAGSATRLNAPRGLAISTDNLTLYVADSGNHNIKTVSVNSPYTSAHLAGDQAGSPSSGTTDNTGSLARFNNPSGCIVDGLNLLVADSGNHSIRQIVISSGVVTTYSGLSGTSGDTDNTSRSLARYKNPIDIVKATTGFYVVENTGHRVRRIVPGAATEVRLWAGSAAASTGSTDNNTGSSATFNAPTAICLTNGEELIIADGGNFRIRRVSTKLYHFNLNGSSSFAIEQVSDTHARPNILYIQAPAVQDASLADVAFTLRVTY